MPAQDISNLNGVVFTEADRGALRNPTYTNTGGPGSGAGVLSGTSAYTYAGTHTYNVTVLNSTYVPSTNNGVTTSLPVFGEIKVVEHAGAQTHTYYFNVLGFTSNGIITGSQGTTPAGAGKILVNNSTGALIGGNEVFATVASSSGSFPLTFGQTNDFVAPCYAEGTRILTLRGEVAVEDLVEGDVAMTASGATRPVIWIGSRQVRPMSHPVPAELNPVRVRRGAFGEGAPSRDLVLSPGHAVFVDGVLVPVGKLVNGATIVQEDVDSVRYFHVELDAHDVLLAEGLACESYLDDGNRDSFANSPEHTALHGRLDPVDWERACAPVVRGGEALARLQAKLHARAEAMGWVRSTDHGLTLIADGAELAAVHATAQRLWFAVPACAELVLASAAGRPLELVPGALDPRRLGVAVTELRLDGEPLDLAAETFGPGFHALEQDTTGAWRWTDGSARLTLDLARPAMVEITLRAAAYAWRRPAPTLRLVTTG